MTRLAGRLLVSPLVLLLLLSLPLRAQDLSSGSQSSATPDQLGMVSGTVMDVNDDTVQGATVTLIGPESSDRRSLQTNDRGFFQFRDVPPGITYRVTITGQGFTDWTSPPFVLAPSQAKELSIDKLQPETVHSSVVVHPETEEEIATEQVHEALTQRGFAIIPNFFAVYVPHPAPLTPALKFKLSLRTVVDPVTIAGVAFSAGINQAYGTPSYGGGMEGYAKRFGASYANNFTDIMFSGAILPTVLHQDPRYYYQGTGTAKSRALHAMSALVLAKGDNGRTQFNYSSVGGDLISSAISQSYYPASQRGVGLFFQNFAIQTAIHLSARLLQEFVFVPHK